MPRLYCSVSNCQHNADSCCSLSAIEIDGAGANCAENTSCGDFVEGFGIMNSAANANPVLEVRCEATNCVHNSGGQCGSDFMSVSGMNATSCVGTECSSFCEI
ncbi:DUF1540 domain-containing protein [Candidatus Epulonipiscium viviparus]|uniref:DUF1540 domain-containing protein n=1 Tax=Candidatus Epulonipiscium viviparus TaxID=420336 RepID=UPI00016BFE13|nr:DUF1540 domain-containing protein [Candidatus Epulopiscium viviparus]